MREERKQLLETTTGEYRMCCPFCVERLLNKPVDQRSDTKYHLYINVKKGLYFCHRCEANGSSDSLQHYLHSVDQTVDVQDIVARAKKTLSSRKPDYTYFNPDSLGSPPVEGAPSWAYLTRERKLTPEQIRYYDIRSGKEEMTGRIVVPVYDAEGYCIYYSGRAYGGRKPKYKNPTVDKKNVIFHLHGVKTDHVIVCEGVFSAIHAGYSAIAILGKYVSNWQFSAITRRWQKVYLAFDGDVLRKDESLPEEEKKIPKIVHRLQRNGCGVGVVPLPGTDDPEDVGADKFQELVRQTPMLYLQDIKAKINISRRKFY